MHKKIFLPVLLMLSLHAFSQESNFGIKVGVNYADVFGDLTDGINARPSLEAGIFAEFPLMGKFSFHPEMLYSSRRNSFYYQDPANFEGNPREGDLVQNNHTIAFPLITRYNYNEKLSLEFGPQIGFSLTTKSKLNDTERWSSQDFKFDIGPTIGVGYDMNDRIKLQLRYFLGLSDILRTSDYERVTDTKSNQFNSVISLSAGFIIFK